MIKIKEFFEGKKAYIIGALLIVLGLLQGQNEVILEGLAVITLRAGISKIQ